MKQKLQGIFPVLPTPFDKNQEISYQDIERIVDFAVDCGVQGVTVNDFFGESEYMLDDERKKVAEIVLSKAAGRVPVIVGVSAVSPEKMVNFAVHAQTHGAAAVLCSVPFLRPFAWQAVVDRGFKPMNQALDIPIILCNNLIMLAGMSVEQQKELLIHYKNIQYVRNDSPAMHNAITATAEMAGTLPESCFEGSFAGPSGYDMVHEFQRGATGFMPGVHAADQMALIWESLTAGDFTEAERLQFALARMQLLERLYPIDTCKYMLRARGVISNVNTRTVGKAHFDKINVEELNRILDALETKVKLVQMQ